MADEKITALTELTGSTDDDILAIVDDPGGTPVTKKITVKNLLNHNTKLVADTQPISSTGLLDISGLVYTVSTNGIYRVQGCVMYSISGAGVTKVGLSSPGCGSMFGAAWGDVTTGSGAGGGTTAREAGGYFNFKSTAAGNSIIFSAGTSQATGIIHGVSIDFLMASAVAGTFALMAAVSATTTPITILAGSYIRVYKLA